ncbi:SusC/RagA family TonB-linked outer membrane protein [Polaribacter vadi]|uniref:SusC/RagA family TonB-linked outer membrane protein n=1 Tax=Polaribacter vadi TaxID=1774273 RepID=UPI0030EBB552|tara:strand:+ start:13741 stop:16872 length:3132 start_codon:yes stop_codon:yes gene_type:complete
MKQTYKKGLLLFLFLGAILITNAQSVSISGTVNDSSGVLPGVSVSIKGTSKGTETDFNGKYTINAEVGNTLIYRYLGYKKIEKVIGNSRTIDVTMLEDNSVLEEVVVVAYGTTTKEALTGSVGIVDEKDLETRNLTSPIAAIEGKVTGVQFTSTNGQPGSTPSIIIRGVGTLNGSTDPLFIVDGIQFEGGLNTINQEDIASLTVLKDAASTSLYGARAANGVVIITTKTGKNNGAIKVSASMQGGIVTRSDQFFYDEVSPGEYYEVMWEALKNSPAGNGDPAFASANIYNQLGYNPFNVANDQIVGVDGKINPNAQVIYKSLDWFDFMEQTGVRQNYNVNVSGGGENHRIFFSTSYLEEEGYVKTTNYDRLTSRLNANFDVNDKLKIAASANITLAESSGPSSAGTGSIVNPFGFAQGIGSVYPVFVNDLNGNLALDEIGNPLFDNGEGYSQFNIGSRPYSQGRHALQELLLNDERDLNNAYGFRFSADYEILEGLTFSLNYGRDIQDLIEKEYENNIIGDAQPDGRYSETRGRREVQNFTQVLKYNKSFKQHNFDLTLGHESFNRLFSGNNGLATVQSTAGIFEFVNFSNIVSLGGSSSRKSVEGYFSRLNYNYDNKYFLSASFRRDASSVFSQDSRWGNFYSIGGSWSIDKEKFMENVSFIDRLKLRASWGEVGNDNLGDFFLYQARFGITSNAALGAFAISDLGNNDLQWETIENFDVALEFTMFNNFLDGSIEYYKRNSTDLLYDLPISPSVGINVQPSNIGDMFNSGVELSLTAHLLKNQDFKWDMTLQASTLKNEITFLPDPFVNGSKRWEIGRSRFDFFLLKTAGVDPATGDQLFLKYEINADGDSVPVLDANGNIETTNDWEDTERAYTGDSSIPDILGSISNDFSYKGISLNFLITYGIGGSVLDNGYSSMMHSGSYGDSVHPDALNAWKQPGDITDVPRLENGNIDLVRTQSDRFITDASFWSLRNVNLGYAFNDNVLDNLGIDALRVSLTGENLYFKSARKGLNPQFGLAGTAAGNSFNPARIFSLGLNVSF